MAIKVVSVEELNRLGQSNMGGHLGIEFTEVTEEFIAAKMPVDHRTKQPYGILHGGASVVLAETLGSVGSSLCTDMNRFNCVGLEINANHIRSVTDGFVYGKATPIHIGRTTQVWDIRIHNEAEKLVCISRLTIAVIPKQSTQKESI